MKEILLIYLNIENDLKGPFSDIFYAEQFERIINEYFKMKIIFDS